MKKIVWPGLLAGLVMLIVTWLVSVLFGVIFPSLTKEYASGLFRAWTDPLMSLYFIYPFLLGILLAWAWSRIKTLVKGKTVWCRGWNFALGYFLIASIPGMFITYSSFVVSFPMVLSWLVGGLVGTFFAGVIFAWLNK